MTSDPINEQLRRTVIAARAEFVERQFGPPPAEIQKILNLTNMWDGGICQMAAPHLAGMGVCLTDGLTDADMPARLRLTPEGPRPREPRDVPPGLAGYGFELAVLTPKPDPWPLLTLSWFVQMEILNDLRLLDRVAAGNGVTAEGVKIGDGSRTAHFLVQPACAPVIARVNLPNGLMHLLIATWITPDELQFANSNDEGSFALLNRLVDAGVGPVSQLDRPSVLATNGEQRGP
jgi:hypothetical protein